MTEEGQQGSSARRLTAEKRSVELSDEDIVSSWKEKAKRDAARRRHQEEIEKASLDAAKRRQRNMARYRQRETSEGARLTNRGDGDEAALRQQEEQIEQFKRTFGLSSDAQLALSGRKTTSSALHA